MLDTTDVDAEPEPGLSVAQRDHLAHSKVSYGPAFGMLPLPRDPTLPPEHRRTWRYRQPLAEPIGPFSIHTMAWFFPHPVRAYTLEALKSCPLPNKLRAGGWGWQLYVHFCADENSLELVAIEQVMEKVARLEQHISLLDEYPISAVHFAQNYRSQHRDFIDLLEQVAVPSAWFYRGRDEETDDPWNSLYLFPTKIPLPAANGLHPTHPFKPGVKNRALVFYSLLDKLRDCYDPDTIFDLDFYAVGTFRVEARFTGPYLRQQCKARPTLRAVRPHLPALAAKAADLLRYHVQTNAIMAPDYAPAW
jgi:hypothetical protein